jgi:hypothetical protein
MNRTGLIYFFSRWRARRFLLARVEKEPSVGEGMNFPLQEPDAEKLHVRFDERDVETERFSPPRRVSTLPIRSSLSSD